MRSLATAALAVLLLPAMASAHGGSFRGRGGGVPPGLPGQPTKVAESGGQYHTWVTWWSYNQFRFLDYRNRQAARRGPVSGSPTAVAKQKEDPNAWRGDVVSKWTPLMLKSLSDEDEEVRTAAAVALGKWRVKEAADALKKLRERDQILQVRESALLGLMLLRDPRHFEYFRAILRTDKELPRMRGYALLGIGLSGDKRSRDYLFSLLDPKSREHDRLPTMDRQRRHLLCAAVAGLTYEPNPALGPELLAVAKNPRLDERVRAYALAGLGKLQARDQLHDVVGILRGDKSVHMRRSAAIVAGELGTPGDADVLGALRRALQYDKDRIVSHFATIGLGQIGGPLGFTFLMEAHKKANKEALGFFYIAFGLCKEPGGVALLKKALVTTKNARDRAAAGLALGLMDDPENAGAVREAFDNAKDWMLLQSTMLSLGILDHKPSADPIKALLITKKQPALRTSAALSYALIRQWSAVGVLRDVLKSAKSVVTLGAIAQVMGFLSSPAAVDPLVEMVGDKHLQRQARAFALVAIGALGDPEPLPILMRMAFGLNYIIRSDPVDEAITIL